MLVVCLLRSVARRQYRVVNRLASEDKQLQARGSMQNAGGDMYAAILDQS